MTPTPQDRERAEEALRKANLYPHPKRVAIIASALAAERERCEGECARLQEAPATESEVMPDHSEGPSVRSAPDKTPPQPAPSAPAGAIDAEITRLRSAPPVTTEGLDQIQFGRVLHKRPVPEDMVERACEAWRITPGIVPTKMRAALTAALAPGGS